MESISDDVERVELVRCDFLFDGCKDHEIELSKLFPILQNPCVKQLRLNHLDERGVDNLISKKKAQNLLQLTVPESPKAIELNQRLQKEINGLQGNQLYSWQIEKLENKIKNEIELKYNTFDANELSEGKYKYQWSTNIELLEFDRLWFGVSEEIMELFKDKLTCQRVKSAYKNLRGLIIGGIGKDLGAFVCQTMLNNLACQLESLHLNCENEYVGLMDKWKFISNDYSILFVIQYIFFLSMFTFFSFPIHIFCVIQLNAFFFVINYTLLIQG